MVSNRHSCIIFHMSLFLVLFISICVWSIFINKNNLFSFFFFLVQKFHCGSLIFESFLEAVNQSLAHKMFISYNALIESSPSLTVGNATYQVDIRCNNDCLTAAGAKQGNLPVHIISWSSLSTDLEKEVFKFCIAFLSLDV